MAMQVQLGLSADTPVAHRYDYSPPLTDRSSITCLSQASASLLSLRFMASARRGVVSMPVGGTIKPTIASAPPESSTLSSPRDSTELEREHDDQGHTLSPGMAHSSRPKSSFRFAHPPPGTRHKRLRIRPRLLLQLQRVSKAGRPIPILDLLPSTLFQAKSPRKISNPLRGKDRIGPNDLLIVPSESYEPLEERAGLPEEDSDAHRNLVAVISQPRKEDLKQKGVGEIFLEKGGSWTATTLPSGGYEFVSVNENGVQQCVRWVLRNKANRHSTGSPTALELPTPHNRRFTFSIIDPTTRRHPVIAWASKQGIDILDRYPLHSEPGQSRAASPAFSVSTVQDHRYSQSIVETSDQLRTLINVTGIWVALREGWSQNPLLNEASSIPRSKSTSSPPPPQRRHRFSDFTNHSTDGSSYVQDTHPRYFSFASDRASQTNAHTLRRSYPDAAEPPEPSQPLPSSRPSTNSTPHSLEIQKPGLQTSPRGRQRKRRSMLCIGRHVYTPESSERTHSPETFHRGQNMPRDRPESSVADTNGHTTPATVHSPSRPAPGKRRKWYRLGNWVSKRRRPRD